LKSLALIAQNELTISWK